MAARRSGSSPTPRSTGASWMFVLTDAEVIPVRAPPRGHEEVVPSRYTRMRRENRSRAGQFSATAVAEGDSAGKEYRQAVAPPSSPCHLGLPFPPKMSRPKADREIAERSRVPEWRNYCSAIDSWLPGKAIIEKSL